jgi:hypothetical protein
MYSCWSVIPQHIREHVAHRFEGHIGYVFDEATQETYCPIGYAFLLMGVCTDSTQYYLSRPDSLNAAPIMRGLSPEPVTEWSLNAWHVHEFMADYDGHRVTDIWDALGVQSPDAAAAIAEAESIISESRALVLTS